MVVKVDTIEEAAYIIQQAVENKRLTTENARLHEAENEIIGLQDALIIAKEELRDMRAEVARLRDDAEEHAIALDYILIDIAWLHEYLDTAECPVSVQFVMDKLEDMFECDIEGDKKYGKALADIRGEPPRPRLLELVRAFKESTAKDERIAELEETLVSLLDSARNQEAFDGNMVAVLLNGPIVSRDAIEKARAALGEKAAPADTVCVPRSLLEPFVQVAAALERYEKMAGRKLPDCAPVCAPLEVPPKSGTYISLGEVRALARIANGEKAAPEEESCL
jgi:hypothetical protein